MNRLFASLVCALPMATLAADAQFVGTATPVNGGDPFYTETHAITGTCENEQFRPESHTIVYSRDGQGAFAEKSLSYDVSASRPTVDFKQSDFSETMKITNDQDATLEIEWQKPSGATESSSVEVTPTLVADAGFDNFVRRNWSRVIGKSQSVEFDILAPTRGDHYRFVLEPTEDSRIDADHVVRIKPSGILMGLLVDQIVLGYNSRGFLTHYLGLTNIRKDKDNNYTALIRYSIQTAPDCELIL